MNAEEIRRIEARWKSDVDLKLDTLIRDNEARSKKYDAFIDIMIEREKERAALRRAVIDKTLSGLILAAVVGLATLAWNGVLNEITHAVRVLRGGGK